jgi:hypothetical protein
MVKDSFKRRYVSAVLELAREAPFAGPDGGIVVGPPPDWMEDPRWDRRSLSMATLRALLRDMRQAEGLKVVLQADGMPPYMDVCVMLKGMHSGGYGREHPVLVYLDGLRFYLTTGRDPYMHWGPGKVWD